MEELTGQIQVLFRYLYLSRYISTTEYLYPGSGVRQDQPGADHDAAQGRAPEAARDEGGGGGGEII